MKFNLPEVPAPLEPSNELAVGNVYAAKGGKPTRYWVVAGIRGTTVILLGLDAEGVLCSSTTYNRSVMEGGPYQQGRPILGHCHGLDDLNFDVIWREQI